MLKNILISFFLISSIFSFNIENSINDNITTNNFTCWIQYGYNSKTGSDLSG